MIISHTHRYIFFAVPKTATHSVREALRQSKASDDWEQQVLFGQQAIPIPEIAKITHGHISVQQIQPWLEEAQWQSYFKFAFVRNPFDRFVSVCAFLNRENPSFKDNSLAWMKAATRRAVFRERILVRPQSLQLTDDSGKLVMDYIGRYEQLQESLNHVFSKLDLAAIELNVRNRSEHAAYQQYYDDELHAWVSDFYRRDIELFDYRY